MEKGLPQLPILWESKFPNCPSAMRYDEATAWGFQSAHPEPGATLATYATTPATDAVLSAISTICCDCFNAGIDHSRSATVRGAATIGLSQ
jgi:hypothetical protein